MNNFRKTLSFFNNRKTFITLCSIYAIIGVLFFVFNLNAISGDQYAYMYYSKGLHRGNYTYWYMLRDYIPDTIRNPGYPLFIYLFSFLTEDLWLTKFAQLIIFTINLIIFFKIIDIYTNNKNYVIKNIFLLLLILNSHLLLYIDMIFPEILMLFLISILVYADLILPKNKTSTYIILGLLYGVAFQVRPAILFYPFIKFFIDFLFQKRNFVVIKNGLLLLVFVATMLPYGYWNYKNHGIFTLTSLEGGGGVMHLSYWSLKTPNYLETRIWRNIAEENLISFTPKKDVETNIIAFNKEWDFIDSSCAQYLTEKDKINIPLMKKNPELFLVYNGNYTYHRDKLLKKLAIQHFIDDPVFTLKVKTYTIFRLWITGIKRKTFESNNPIVIFKGVAPTIVTGFTLLLALIFIPLAMIKRKFNYPFLLPILFLVGYYGFIHLPFAIQARYTIPVRPLLMLITAICIFELYFNKEIPNE